MASLRERLTSWDFPPGTRPLPLIIAHRGDQSNAPENTLPAFQRAYESGADGIELDVRLTRDGQLVVFHDRGLKRIGKRRGLVTNTTLDEMRELDVGAWFGPEYRGERPPTLDEVFELLPADFLINVEMKAVIDGMKVIAHKVAEVARRHQRWGSTLVASFNPISLWELRKIEPRLMRGYIWSRRHPPPIRSPLLQPAGQGALVRSGERQLQPRADAQDARPGGAHPGLGRRFRFRPGPHGEGQAGRGGHRRPGRTLASTRHSCYNGCVVLRPFLRAHRPLTVPSGLEGLGQAGPGRWR